MYRTSQPDVPHIKIWCTAHQSLTCRASQPNVTDTAIHIRSTLIHNALQNGPNHTSKRAISRCDMARFALRFGPKRKWFHGLACNISNNNAQEFYFYMFSQILHLVSITIINQIKSSSSICKFSRCLFASTCPLSAAFWNHSTASLKF